MKPIPTKYKSLVLQIIFVQIQATYSSYLTQKNFFYSNNEEGTGDYKYKNAILKDFYYLPQSLQMKDQPIFFIRKAKSSNQTRMLNIDLSGLRKDKDHSKVHGNIRHKPPVGLLGIDMSVLSRNPDPSLPMAVVHPQNMLNGKSIMSYEFDPKYDRLPVIKTKPMKTYLSMTKPATVHPIMHVPLKVMTTYHSIFTNKKQDFDFNFDRSLNDIENEQKYTANFILHLLYQLSSSSDKMN